MFKASEDFYDKTLSPEENLLVSMIRSAFVDISASKMDSLERGNLRKDALNWVMGRAEYSDQSYPFSFERVCERLNYDVGKLRGAANDFISQKRRIHAERLGHRRV